MTIIKRSLYHTPLMVIWKPYSCPKIKIYLANCIKVDIRNFALSIFSNVVNYKDDEEVDKEWVEETHVPIVKLATSIAKLNVTRVDSVGGINFNHSNTYKG